MPTVTDRQVRRLALLTLFAVALYLIVDLALRFLRPEYSLVYNAESDYGHGSWFWVMDLNFLLRCVFSLTLVAVLSRTVPSAPRLRGGLALIAIWAAASGLLAFFADNIEGQHVHGSGVVHLALAVIAFVAVAVGTIRVSASIRDEASWGWVGGVLSRLSVLGGAALVLLGVTFNGRHPPVGLSERIFLSLELLWMAVAAAFIARRHRAATDEVAAA